MNLPLTTAEQKTSVSNEILVIAFDNEERSEIISTLQNRGFSARAIARTDRLLYQIAEWAIPPEILLIDRKMFASRALPQEPLSETEQQWPVPIILILMPDELNDIKKLRYIDDFVVRPIEENELIARIEHRLLRETSPERYQISIRQYGDLIIDEHRCQVTIAGTPIYLTFKEYELLRFMATNEGRVFSRPALLNGVWGPDYHGGERTVDVHIRRLRAKIEDGHHTFVDTVRNIGYRFRGNR
ncbi:MAG: response regulator transcription factor [Chloroflexota bacterium]|nr:response regulator transcription factor [Chloroflexota bacterium]